MTAITSIDWDERYRSRSVGPARAARVLTENLHLLPATGRALDLACGLGGNALELARAGLTTHAWDISSVAIERLLRASEIARLVIQTEVRDVVNRPPEPDRFDVIVVSRFLERSLARPLENALRPGGLLFYQTFTRARVTDTGPHNELIRLADNELLALFRNLHLVVYREEGLLGKTEVGLRDEAMLIGQRRLSAHG